MKLSNIILVTAATLASSAINAADISFKAIEQKAVGFMKSTGCYDGGPDPKLVTKFVDKPNGVDSGFVAVVYSDVDCNGGSGTVSTNLVVLRIASGKAGIDDTNPDYLVVDPVMSQPIAGSDLPSRGLTSIYQKNGQLFATGSEYGPNDANCCPSLKTIYKVTLNKKTVAVAKDDNRTLYTWNFLKLKNYQ